MLGGSKEIKHSNVQLEQAEETLLRQTKALDAFLLIALFILSLSLKRSNMPFPSCILLHFCFSVKLLANNKTSCVLFLSFSTHSA